MKVATWNVNSLKMRLPRLLELLALHRPDVVLLQETKCGPEAFPDAALAGGLAGCRVEREFRKGTKPSDHAPLVAEIGD